AAAVTALDRSAASHAALTSAMSTSSSSESRIAIAAAGVGTDMGDNYSARSIVKSPTSWKHNGQRWSALAAWDYESRAPPHPSSGSRAGAACCATGHVMLLLEPPRLPAVVRRLAAPDESIRLDVVERLAQVGTVVV